MSTFKQRYIDEAVSKLSLLYGNDPETIASLKKRVDEIYTEKMNNPNPKTKLKVVNNYKKSEFDVMPEKLLDVLEEKKPVITGYGTLFKTEENVPGKILKSLGASRKIAKAKMLECVNDTDRTLHDMYDIKQKVIKVLANAYYGAFGQSSFHFFNQFLGPSVTYTGVLIIQSAVLAFEAFLSGNFIFENLDELIHYCNNILTEEHFNDILLFEEEIPDIDNVLKAWLKQHSEFEYGELQEEVLNSLVENLSYTQKEVLLCKNNMALFLTSSYVSNLVLSSVHDNFTDANHPPKEIEDVVSELKQITRYYVMYPYQWNNKEYKAERLREVVPISDTDSAFLYIGPYTKWYKEKTNKENLKRIERIACSNVFTCLAATLVKEVFAILTKNLNVPEAERSLIEMKNEFYYSRISISENKKQYAGLCDSKEGKIYLKSKLDVKGLPIKKVSTPKIARAVFTDILQKDILEAEELDPLRVFNRFLDFEKTIKESLMKGETKFTKPSKFTSASIYKLPFQMQQVRGVMLWNELYPKNFIPDFSSINLVRLKSMTKDEASVFFEKKIGKGKEIINVLNKIRKMEFDIKSKLIDPKKKVSDIDEVEYRDIDVIAVPKNLEFLPSELLEIINLNEIIDSNMKNGNILMNIVGFSTLRSLKYDSYSNVISM